MKRNHDLDCPTCGTGLVKSYSGETKLRAKLIKWDCKGMFAVCKGCNGEVSIDIDLIKSIQASFVYEV